MMLWSRSSNPMINTLAHCRYDSRWVSNIIFTPLCTCFAVTLYYVPHPRDNNTYQSFWHQKLWNSWQCLALRLAFFNVVVLFNMKGQFLLGGMQHRRVDNDILNESRNSFKESALCLQISMQKDNLHHGGIEHRDIHNVHGLLFHR